MSKKVEKTWGFESIEVSLRQSDFPSVSPGSGTILGT